VFWCSSNTNFWKVLSKGWVDMTPVLFVVLGLGLSPPNDLL
jgi:hypothetical protein